MSRPSIATRLTALRRMLAPLQARLIALVLLALLPVAGLVVVSTFSARAKAVAATRQDLLRIVHTLSLRQKEYIDSTRELLRRLSHRELLNPERASRNQTMFAEILAFQRAYTDIGLADLAGQVLANGLGYPPSFSLTNRQFFEAILTNTTNWRFVDNDYALDRTTGKAVLYMAHPVADRTDRLEGLVYVALGLDWINRFTPLANLLDGSTLTIIDREGDFLLRYPDPEQRWRRESLADTPDLAALLQQSKEGSGQGAGADGVEYIYAFAPLSSTRGFADAWAVASTPASEVHADAHLVLLKNLAFLGFIGVLALSAAWFGGDVFVLEPVRTLTTATHSIRRGDFQVRTNLKHAPVELAELAQDFEIMAQSLAQRIAERERAEAELRKLNEELEQRVEHRTRELRRSNEELEQFAYVASHDLQEPLRMVISYMQLLKQRYHAKLDANAQDFIGFAVDGSQQMQRLIQDLLSYSRVGTRQRPMEPIDTGQVLERVLGTLKIAIEQSGAVIARGPLPVVLGDSVQLSQLFQNLIGNAIKFHGQNPPQVEIRAERSAVGGELAPWWKFTVQDNGIGIAAENFERIFVIFQRLHSRGKYAGTGIGLAICKKIVERHGGRIWVESESGHGTSFHFTLPATDGSVVAAGGPNSE